MSTNFVCDVVGHVSLERVKLSPLKAELKHWSCAKTDLQCKESRILPATECSPCVLPNQLRCVLVPRTCDWLAGLSVLSNRRKLRFQFQLPQFRHCHPIPPVSTPLSSIPHLAARALPLHTFSTIRSFPSLRDS